MLLILGMMYLPISQCGRWVAQGRNLFDAQKDTEVCSWDYDDNNYADRSMKETRRPYCVILDVDIQREKVTLTWCPQTPSNLPLSAPFCLATAYSLARACSLRWSVL